MHINDDGLNIIKESEGLRLKAYKCPSGVWTIGYGHTGKDVKKGMVITEEKATELLKRDIARFERHVSAYNKIYNFTSNEFSALVSFAFNLGSITGLTKNGIRTKQQIANKMLEYCYAGGKKLNGLYKRRQEERKLFLKKNNNNVSELNNSKNEENIVTKQDAKAFLQIIEILDEIYSYK